MDETRFYQRPGFYIYSRLIFVLTLYSYALYGEWKAGELTPIAVFGDLILFAIQLVIWLAFFAQFVLPVQIFEERRKIFSRLITYLSGLRGPAIFVKNGQAVSRVGESERSGPGVLWLDSASGAVTHISVAFKNTFGPGVHFTGWGEKVGETVDLHTQVQKIGPAEADHPFDVKGDTAEDIYAEVQRRRTMVSALSRDGIEVLPDISVNLRSMPIRYEGISRGSHFGYSEEAVRQAVINQAVNPNAQPNTLEYKVAWNELPAALAADLWREYLSKFTLGQLFTAGLILPASVPLPKPQASNPDADAIRSPVSPYEQNVLARALTGMLHVLSVWFGRFADRLEAADRQPVLPARPIDIARSQEPGKKTALQVINFMIKERMTNPFVPQMDPNGQRLPGWQESREYWALKNRGIRVLSVSVSNLRFQPRVEEQLTNSWTSNWLLNARAERERIETARSFAALSGQEKALTDYALELTSDLMEQKAASASLKDAVRALLVRSRMILVRSDRMHRRASNELQGLESVMQWLESDPT